MQVDVEEKLRTDPTLLKSGVCLADPEVVRVDRKGGQWGAGVIRGVSVITRGEALGHDLWLDDVFLDQVEDALNLRNKGEKSRFTHPGISGDGLGRHVGRVMAGRREGDRVFGDQHFIEAAHNTPNGDLAGHLLDLAEQDPEAYGLSIVFEHDRDAERAFHAANQVDGRFASPDPDNVRNLPHARLARLRAVDSVGDPAANPAGLFSADQSVAELADHVFRFAHKLTDEPPNLAALGVEVAPARLRGARARFFENHRTELQAMAATKTDTETKPAEKPAELTESKPAEKPAELTESKPAEKPAETKPAELTSGADDVRAAFLRFKTAFGDAQAAEYFAAGLTFGEAQERFTAHLQKENAALRQRLEGQGAALGEESPVEFESGEPEDKRRRGFASKIRIK